MAGIVDRRHGFRNAAPRPTKHFLLSEFMAPLRFVGPDPVFVRSPDSLRRGGAGRVVAAAPV
jgi:hypothetical protein